MRRPKATLPYGAGSLLEFQTRRLAKLFGEVLVVLKSPPDFPVGPARVVLDRRTEPAPIFGLLRALEETPSRVFVMAVDLPLLPDELIGAIARRGLRSSAPALVPHADGLPQPLAAVWDRAVLPFARERVARGDLSLNGLAEEAGAEVLTEPEWRAHDPSGNAFTNFNTIEAWATLRERA
jgi:molybdopterin-guanine dinucleotide biosynthesis protein A